MQSHSAHSYGRIVTTDAALHFKNDQLKKLFLQKWERFGKAVVLYTKPLFYADIKRKI